MSTPLNYKYKISSKVPEVWYIEKLRGVNFSRSPFSKDSCNDERASTSCSVQQTTEVVNKQIFPYSVVAAAFPI